MNACACVSTCKRACVPACAHTCVCHGSVYASTRTCGPAHMPVCMCACVRACVMRGFVVRTRGFQMPTPCTPDCVHACVRAWVRAQKRASVRVCVRASGPCMLTSVHFQMPTPCKHHDQFYKPRAPACQTRHPHYDEGQPMEEVRVRVHARVRS